MKGYALRSLLPLFLFAFTALAALHEDDNEKKLYIVHLGGHPIDEASTVKTHINLLAGVRGSEDNARESIVYSYHKTFNAFAAKLSKNEANELSEMDEVTSVYKNRYHKLHTTKSWDFLGFPQTAGRSLQTESDVIVGVLDTGITPQSESFRDDGFGPPPAKWKGICAHSANFSGCNNKLIGARYFNLDGKADGSDSLSPIDEDGHGTHTSSTIAGAHVANASLFGLAAGTARGAVPGARIAMYKVCWSRGCGDADILAGFDAAVADGVDVISVSIRGRSTDYTADSIPIGAFHAMKKGVVTVASAGNEGPSTGSVVNHAPWMLTVAASGIDRQFRSKVVLSNGKNITGIGISMFDPKGKAYQLVTGEDTAINTEMKDSARFCNKDSLNPSKAKGKMVLCLLGTWGADSVVKGIGGAGTIIASKSSLDDALIFMAPGTVVDVTVAQTLTDYIHSERLSATVYRTQEQKIQAPFIASFSSRGPNPGSERLLKPDIAAPGIDILAAYTPLRTLTGLDGDTQHSQFTLMSGTSMACSHVAGVAAYVKSFHPKWSPAAIASAIITSAKPMSKRRNKEAELAYGAGQVNPRRAAHPGLIYDMDEISHIQFLCREGYKGSLLAALVGSKSVNCSSLVPSAFGYDSLNYPTMQLHLDGNEQGNTAVFQRRVTNVGPSQSVYTATVRAPKGVNITVSPRSLSFSSLLQTQSFKVIVHAMPAKGVRIVSGSLIWKSPQHTVRSPIVVSQFVG